MAELGNRSKQENGQTTLKILHIHLILEGCLEKILLVENSHMPSMNAGFSTSSVVQVEVECHDTQCGVVWSGSF